MVSAKDCGLGYRYKMVAEVTWTPLDALFTGTYQHMETMALLAITASTIQITHNMLITVMDLFFLICGKTSWLTDWRSNFDNPQTCILLQQHYVVQADELGLFLSIISIVVKCNLSIFLIQVFLFRVMRDDINARLLHINHSIIQLHDEVQLQYYRWKNIFGHGSKHLSESL